MAEILTYVYINLDGEDIPVGRLWSYLTMVKKVLHLSMMKAG